MKYLRICLTAHILIHRNSLQRNELILGYTRGCPTLRTRWSLLMAKYKMLDTLFPTFPSELVCRTFVHPEQFCASPQGPVGEDAAQGDAQFWNRHDPVYISTPKGKLFSFSEKQIAENFPLTFRTAVQRPLQSLQQFFAVATLWKTNPFSCPFPFFALVLAFSQVFPPLWPDHDPQPVPLTSLCPFATNTRLVVMLKSVDQPLYFQALQKVRGVICSVLQKVSRLVLQPLLHASHWMVPGVMEANDATYGFFPARGFQL